jgi:alpha-ketoglutarate-dependent taurine dioxygenase
LRIQLLDATRCGRSVAHEAEAAHLLLGKPEGAHLGALAEELKRHDHPRHLTYRHRWSPGQLILWDNRCVLHRATPYDPATQRRVIRRCTVLGRGSAAG